MENFPANDPVVAWGVAFPYESIYPVLKQSKVAMKYQLYSPATSLIPSTRAYVEQAAGRGMVSRLLSQTGIPVITDNGYPDDKYYLLQTYCREHFDGVLIELFNAEYGRTRVTQLRCERKVAP